MARVSAKTLFIYTIFIVCLLCSLFLVYIYGPGLSELMSTSQSAGGYAAVIFNLVVAAAGLLSTAGIARLLYVGLRSGKNPWKLSKGVWWFGLASTIVSLFGLLLILLYIAIALNGRD